MKTEYAIINAAIGDTERDYEVFFRSSNPQEIINNLKANNYDPETTSIEDYTVDDDGEFYEGSNYDTIDNFIKRNGAANELIIDLWNDYCERTNTHERDYYKMSELEEVLRGVEGDILSDDFDKSMPYFTQDSNGKLISVDRLLDVYREEMNGGNDLCVKVWEQDLYVYINEDDITGYKTDDLYYEQAYQLDDGRWIAFDEAVNAWVMLG